MAYEHLSTYLNDHLAGSVVAVELLENLETIYAKWPIARFAAELRGEIEADVKELESIMTRLEISPSRTRQASAWFTEKFTQLKLRVDDPEDGDLRLFESLEALSLGIEGKKTLWLALAKVSETSPQLRLADYANLISRAGDQRSRVEEKRLEVAREALK